MTIELLTIDVHKSGSGIAKQAAQPSTGFLLRFDN
jgi:hypothetical protein